MKKKTKSFKDNSVKKLIVLFIAEKVPENYLNIKSILKELDIFGHGMIDMSEITFASDLKLINIMLGLQSHSCMHACSWCECPTRGQNAYQDQDSWPMRTLGGLRTHATNYKAAGSKKDKAKDYKNVIHVPLLNGPNELEVMSIIPPPRKF